MIILHFTTRLVNSTAIRAIAYCEPHELLRIVFRSGAVYDYSEVAPEVYQNLQEAESIGRYFGQHVRNSFTSERLEATRGQDFIFNAMEAAAGQTELVVSEQVDS